MFAIVTLAGVGTANVCEEKLRGKKKPLAITNKTELVSVKEVLFERLTILKVSAHSLGTIASWPANWDLK